MGKEPQQRGGLVLRGAHLFQFEVVNSRARVAVTGHLRGRAAVSASRRRRTLPLSIRRRRRLGRPGPLRHGSSGGRTRLWPTGAHHGPEWSVPACGASPEASIWLLGRPTCMSRPRTISRCVRTSRRGTRPDVSGARSWPRTSTKLSLGSDPSAQRASILLRPPFHSNRPEGL